MKRLKFEHSLVQMILDGRKTATWRIFDDKELKIGDDVELIEFDTGEIFAKAQIVSVQEKKWVRLQKRILNITKTINRQRRC